MANRLQLVSDSGTETLAAGAGSVVAQTWHKDILYALVIRQKRFSFGVNLRTYLVRWQRDAGAGETLLADVTVDPSLPTFVGDAFPAGPILLVSPYGDEIVYTRIHDPPAFSPEYRVLVRHLVSGRERLLSRHALSGGAVALYPDGESILLSDGRKVSRISLWGEEQTVVADTPASELDVGGDYRFLAGRLMRGDDLVWEHSGIERAVFSPDGAKLALVARRHIYIVELQSQQAHPDVKVTAERLQLRRLRALGLISHEEYLRYTE